MSDKPTPEDIGPEAVAAAEDAAAQEREEAVGKLAAAKEAAKADPKPEVPVEEAALDTTGADAPVLTQVKPLAPKDLDLDLDAVNELRVRLGGRRWLAVEPTIDVNIALTATLPTLRGEDGSTAEQAQAALEGLYPQVRMILKDPTTGDPPSRDFVQKHLTARNFGRLIDAINGAGQEGDPQVG